MIAVGEPASPLIKRKGILESLLLGSSSSGMESSRKRLKLESGTPPIRADRYERANDISTGVSIDQVGLSGDGNIADMWVLVLCYCCLQRHECHAMCGVIGQSGS